MAVPQPELDNDPEDELRPGSDELQSLTEEGLKRFGLFVADWEAEEVQMLTSLLQKLEASKAAVAARQRPPSGRRWTRQNA